MEQKNWVMEKLARSLTEKERTQFLKQIHTSLHDEADEQNKLDRVDTSQDEIKIRLRQEIRKMSPLRYLFLLIRRIFSGKSIEQVVLEYKLKRLRHAVRQKAPGIVSFETRTFRPHLAEKVFELFVATIPLRNFFEKLWKEHSELGNLHQLVYSLIENQINVTVNSCFDLLPIEEMVNLYRSSGSRDSIIQETNSRLETYIEGIDTLHFRRVEEILVPLYYLRDLILFPYSRFFGIFHGTIRSDDPEYQPLFQKTAALPALDEVEELYYALYSAHQTRITRNFNVEVVEDIFETLFPASYSADDSSAVPGTEEENETRTAEEAEEAEGNNIEDSHRQDQKRNQEEGQRRPEEKRGDTAEGVDTDAQKFIGDLERVVEHAKKFLKNVPLPQMVRALKEDPYYRLLVYMPSIDAKGFYKTMKKLTIRGDIDEKLSEVRREALAQERGELFRAVKMRALHFYRTYSSIEYEKLGISPFRYYQALLVLFNFLSTFYRGNIQKVLQLLDGLITEQDRITRERLLKHSSTCEDVLYKINELDDSLSPEQEEGKKFQKLRFETSLEPIQQRMYQSIVIKKDREAAEILNRGREAVRGIRLLFQDFLQNREPKIQASMEKRYLIQGQAIALKEVLQRNNERILLLEVILNQLEQIRDETGSDEVTL